MLRVMSLVDEFYVVMDQIDCFDNDILIETVVRIYIKENSIHKGNGLPDAADCVFYHCYFAIRNENNQKQIIIKILC